MKKYLLFIVSGFLIFNLFQGCVPSKPTEEIEILPSERLINRLEANRRKIRSFEGYGTMHVKSPQFDNKATFRVVLQKPDSLQLNIIGPFGIELADILVTDREFVFYDAIQNNAYTGVLSKDILRQIFKIDLDFGALMDAFIGSVNLTPNLYKQPTSYKIEDDQYILSYVDSLKNITYKYKIDIRQLGIKEYQIYSDENDIYLHGEYSDFEFLENVAVPYKIQVTNIPENQNITLVYKSMVANKPSIKIDFSVPEDAEIIKW